MIQNLLRNALSNQSYEKILNCINALRETCVKEDEGLLFNEFMQDLKKKLTLPDVDAKIYIHRDFWKVLIEKKINLIKAEGGKEGATEDEFNQYLEIPTTETVENSIKESVENTGDIDDLVSLFFIIITVC